MTKTDLRDYSKSKTEQEISDPLELLKSLSSHLDAKGGIISASETLKIVSLMRSCKMLVGRCIYLSILRVTKGEDILRKFMSDGGWKVLNKWISECKETENYPIMLEILKLLHQLPVTIQDLRENNTPKIVKHCAKSQDSKIKSVATGLMQSWMAIITGGTAAIDTEPAKKKRKEKEKKKIKVEEKPMKSKSEKSSAPPPVMKTPSFAKIRKTGLETEQTLPKKKSKSKPVQGSGKRSSTETDLSVPEKKVKTEVKQPKKIMISEGEGFMDALNSASNPLPLTIKKTKRRPTKPTPTTVSSSSKSPQNTEIMTGDANDFSATELLRKISPNQSPVHVEPAKPKLNKYGKPMKTVRFKADQYLESVRYFEIDENERVNVSTQSFKDAQHREMMIERQLLKGGKLSEEIGDGEWQRPTVIDGLETLVVVGCNSIEKDIQMEREKTVLMSIFLSKEMVPDTPTEPDPEPYEIIQPKIIPFDDENAVPEEPMEQEPESSSSANDVIMKNMLEGMQARDGNDLTEKLKQILQTATAITANNGDGVQQNPGMVAPPQQQGMVWVGEGAPPPQGNPPMAMMGVNGQMVQPQMEFYGNQPMMVQDPNFYPPQNWPGPNMRPLMNGPPQRPMFNQGWMARPQWREERPARGHPPRNGGRNDFRGRGANWKGRWNDGRRR